MNINKFDIFKSVGLEYTEVVGVEVKYLDVGTQILGNGSESAVGAFGGLFALRPDAFAARRARGLPAVRPCCAHHASHHHC